jgi:hypothetical protein
MFYNLEKDIYLDDFQCADLYHRVKTMKRGGILLCEIDGELSQKLIGKFSPAPRHAR